jgi:hypothetical protein
MSRRHPHLAREDGQSLVIVVLFLAVAIGICAISLDVGHAYLAQRRLQASVDAAALAGAQGLPDLGAANTLADQYGNGGDNTPRGVDGVQMTVATRCLKSTPDCSPANVVSVTETGSVKTLFAGIFGIGSINVHATAAACSPCGEKPLDIMLVLDRTGSMCTNSAGQPDPNCTDMENARNGLKTFLGLMDPQLDHVGFAVLPPAQNLAPGCPYGGDSSSWYSPTNYVLVPLSSDYKSPNGSLNSSSNLVSAIDCVEANGSTAYANALEAAQAELVKDGRPGVQKVIVMMSDGAANTGPPSYPANSPYRTTPCHQGEASSAVIQSAGTLVYTAGYDVGHDVCKSYTGAPESPAITALQALQGIASPGNFYNQPDAAQMNTIFSEIAADILHGTSRLVDNNA